MDRPSARDRRTNARSALPRHPVPGRQAKGRDSILRDIERVVPDSDACGFPDRPVDVHKRLCIERRRVAVELHPALPLAALAPCIGREHKPLTEIAPGDEAPPATYVRHADRLPYFRN